MSYCLSSDQPTPMDSQDKSQNSATGNTATKLLAVSSVALIGYHLQKRLFSSASDKTGVKTSKQFGSKDEKEEEEVDDVNGKNLLSVESIKNLSIVPNPNVIPLDIPPKYDASTNCVIELSNSQWHEFYENGFVKIGRTLSNQELKDLRQRIEDIMLGEIQYDDKLLMQIDPKFGNSNKKYFDNKVYMKGQTVGFKGETLNYRKIGEAGNGLECDDLYLKFMKKPLFKSICQRIYGKHAPIGVYRSMVFNKPAPIQDDDADEDGDGDDNKDNQGDKTGGSRLPWHQDGGNWWALDRDPQIFIWTALYPSTVESGCVKAIKKSYKLGIIDQEGHMLSEESVNKYCTDDKIVDLITNPGESWLVHNWTIHSSGVNRSNIPRWAFSCNYIDGRTRVLDPKPSDSGPIGTPGQKFAILWKPFE